MINSFRRFFKYFIRFLVLAASVVKMPSFANSKTPPKFEFSNCILQKR